MGRGYLSDSSLVFHRNATAGDTGSHASSRIDADRAHRVLKQVVAVRVCVQGSIDDQNGQPTTRQRMMHRSGRHKKKRRSCVPAMRSLAVVVSFTMALVSARRTVEEKCNESAAGRSWFVYTRLVRFSPCTHRWTPPRSHGPHKHTHTYTTQRRVSKGKFVRAGPGRAPWLAARQSMRAAATRRCRA